MNRQHILSGLLGLFALSGTAVADEVSLSRDVMPLIARSCTGCHQRESGDRKAVESGPYLEKKSDILGVVGTMIVPSKPENSYLLMIMSPPKSGQLKYKMMPPKRSRTPKMTKAELDKISAWIKDGAKDN